MLFVCFFVVYLLLNNILNNLLNNKQLKNVFLLFLLLSCNNLPNNITK